MTREEAIEILCAYGVPQDEKGFREALDIAIEALTQDSRKFTQESTQDLISRQDAIRWVKTECNPYGKPTLDFESGKKVIEHLGQMPSADKAGNGWRVIDYFYQCNNCGWRDYVIEPPKCCPNCGEKIHPLMERRY